MDIRINPEYGKLVPPLTGVELNSLKESIKNNGQWVAITVNQEGVVIDRHHRFPVCQELGIEPITETRTFCSVRQEKEFITSSNAKRKREEFFVSY